MLNIKTVIEIKYSQYFLCTLGHVWRTLSFRFLAGTGGEGEMNKAL